MEFARPYLFWLFLIYIPLIAWYIYKLRKIDPAIHISNLDAVKSLRTSYRVYLKHGLFILRLLAIGCVIVILCRPQTHNKWISSNVEGTDIVIALDMSTSMLAQDFTPDRFGAAKEVAAKFVQGRETDNIGLVVFAGECFTQTPMTNDKTILLNSINSLEMGMLEDGTAIGDGLATAINRIVDGKAKSKSIILLTDGSNNTGLVAPETAADIAREKGIKVYTIGVGSNGSALSPVGINYYGKIEYDSNKERWIFKKGNLLFTLGLTAEGIKKAAIFDILLGNRYLSKDSRIFFDEPEASLHPQAVSDLMDIITVLSKTGIQFFIATHSYFVIKKLFINAMKENLSIPILSLSSDEKEIKYNNLLDGMPKNSIIKESVRLYKEEIGVALR